MWAYSTTESNLSFPRVIIFSHFFRLTWKRIFKSALFRDFHIALYLWFFDKFSVLYLSKQIFTCNHCLDPLIGNNRKQLIQKNLNNHITIQHPYLYPLLSQHTSDSIRELISRIHPQSSCSRKYMYLPKLLLPTTVSSSSNPTTLWRIYDNSRQ